MILVINKQQKKGIVVNVGIVFHATTPVSMNLSPLDSGVLVTHRTEQINFKH